MPLILLIAILALAPTVAWGEPLRLAVLGMPLEELESEMADTPATTDESEANTTDRDSPAEEASPTPPESIGRPATPPLLERETPARSKSSGPESSPRDTTPAQGPAKRETDMALFRIVHDSRHEFFLSNLALPIYGNLQRLDPDLCLAVTWSVDARWQSRMCYSALYGELREEDASSGAVLGQYENQWADGRIDLVDFVFSIDQRRSLGIGWILSRYLLDFSRSGQLSELNGQRVESRTAVTTLSTGLQLAGLYRVDSGSVMRAQISLEPLSWSNLDQNYFVGNDVSVSERRTITTGGAVLNAGLSLTRSLGHGMEGTAILRYRRLALAYETQLQADTADGPTTLIDRFSGSDSLLRTGLRLGFNLPWTHLAPYVEGAVFYASHKNDAKREYLYYSGYRLYLGISRIF